MDTPGFFFLIYSQETYGFFIAITHKATFFQLSLFSEQAIALAQDMPLLSLA